MFKIKSYLGLCIKSGAVVIGQDKLKATKKYPKLLVLSPNATQNLKDLTIRLMDKFHCDCIITNQNLEELISIPNCKLLGVTNPNLATAIVSCDNEYSNLRSSNDK